MASSVAAALVAAALVTWGLTSAFSGHSEQDAIEKSVALIKQQSELPKQVDQVTTWTDVTAEKGAIHYKYTVSSSVDPASVSVTALRNSILPTLCSTAATRSILDHDIAMRYSYAFAGSAKTIETKFTKADC